MTFHGLPVGRWWARLSDHGGSALNLSAMLTFPSHSTPPQLLLSTLHHLCLGFLQGMLQSSHDRVNQRWGLPQLMQYFLLDSLKKETNSHMRTWTVKAAVSSKLGEQA